MRSRAPGGKSARGGDTAGVIRLEGVGVAATGVRQVAKHIIACRLLPVFDPLHEVLEPLDALFFTEVAVAGAPDQPLYEQVTRTCLINGLAVRLLEADGD